MVLYTFGLRPNSIKVISKNHSGSQIKYLAYGSPAKNKARYEKWESNFVYLKICRVLFLFNPILLSYIQVSGSS